MSVSGHCAEEAQHLYEFALYLHEHLLETLRAVVMTPKKAKREVLFEISSNIDTLNELDHELEGFWPKTTRTSVVDALSTIKDQISSMPESAHERIVAEAAEGYEQLIHGVVLPEMLERFADCECALRREHDPDDRHNYLPSFDQVRMRLIIPREFEQPRRRPGHGR